MFRKINQQSKSIAESSKYLTLGLEIFIPSVLGALIGHYWIDNTGETPIWTIVLTLIGFLIGMYNLFKIVIALNKKDKNDRNNNSNIDKFN